MTEPLLSNNNTILLPLLQQHDSSAFTELYFNYSNSLRIQIARIVKDDTAIDDLLQDAFFKIWRNIHLYDAAKGTLYTWMLNVTRNICIDYLRSPYGSHADRLIGEEEADEISLDLARGITTYPDLFVWVQRLKKNLKEVVIMGYVYDFTSEEMAVILNVPVGTVKTRRRTALLRLKVLYGNGN